MSKRLTRKGSVFGVPFLTEEEVQEIEEEANRKRIEKEKKKLERQEEKQKAKELTPVEIEEANNILSAELKERDSDLSGNSEASVDEAFKTTENSLNSISLSNLHSTAFFKDVLSSTAHNFNVDNITNTDKEVSAEHILNETFANMTDFPFTNFHKAIPEFSGAVSDLNRFLACCDLFHGELLTDTHRETFIKALVKKFSGRAFDFYAKQTWTNWLELKNALKKYFSSSKSFEGFQIELSKQKQGMLDVKQFSERIQQILSDMNRVSSEVIIANQSGTQFFKAQNEKLAIKSLINGMNEPIRGYLKSQLFTNLQSTINAAIELESDENFHKNLNTNYNSNQNNIRKVTCFKCQKIGHTANNCRVRLNNINNSYRNNIRFNSNRNNNFNSNFTRSNQITCFRCHKIGHTVPNCRVNLNGNRGSNINQNYSNNSNYSNNNGNNTRTNIQNQRQNSTFSRVNTSRGYENNNRNPSNLIPNRNRQNDTLNRNANIIETKNGINQTVEMDSACLDLIAM